MLKFKFLGLNKRINLGLGNHKRTQWGFKSKIVYLIYTRILVYAILPLAYPKEPYIFLRSTYINYIIWYYLF